MKCLLGMLDILFREVNMKNRRSCRRSKQNTHMHQQETNAVGQLISREKVERLGEKGRKRRGGEGMWWITLKCGRRWSWEKRQKISSDISDVSTLQTDTKTHMQLNRVGLTACCSQGEHVPCRIMGVSTNGLGKNFIEIWAYKDTWKTSWKLELEDLFILRQKKKSCIVFS